MLCVEIQCLYLHVYKKQNDLIGGFVLQGECNGKHGFC